MTYESLATAFNAWMKSYLENPEASEIRFKEQVEKFKADVAAGRTPTYGAETVEQLEAYGA